ncbi:metal ABC transporter solute-binding protein, Zn/Mn family [Aquicella siphonis]|nr:zinc ABC transporter substrate-binding protein [Aquicella siphonis]
MIAKKILSLIIVFLAFISPFVTAAPIQVLCAENFYGQVVKELGGPHVSVTSVITHVSGDPHLFSIQPGVLIKAASADLIIFNGADYDPWIKSILSNTARKHPLVLEAARLMNIKNGSNPHIWFMPQTMPVLARHVTDALTQLDPAHGDDYARQLKHFNDSYGAVLKKVDNLQKQFHGTPVIATEPLFNYMTDAIGLKMLGSGFQNSIMNDIPPTVSQIREFENALNEHKAKVFIYNNQVINPMTEKMLALAKEQHIPVVGVSEIMPSDTTFTAWIMEQLAKLDNALNQKQENK